MFVAREPRSASCSLLLSGLLLLGSLGFSVTGSLPLLDELGDELLVLGSILLALGGLGELVLSPERLAAETLLGHEALDLGGLPESLVSPLDGSVDHVSPDIVLGLVEVEEGSDVASSLLLETVGTLNIGNSGDLLVTLLDNAEGNDGKVGAADASTDGLSLPLTGPARLVSSAA